MTVVGEPSPEPSDGDAAMVEQLRKAGFEGAEYDWFETELVRYGWSVVDAWLKYGQIFAECAKINRPVSPTDRERNQLYADHAEREDLAATIVGFSIGSFREEALVGGGWRPEGDASVKTYFVNHLVREFSNYFRAWRRQNKHWGSAQAETHPREPAQTDPLAIAVQKASVRAAFAKLKPREREVVTLHYDGYSNAEIAELTNAVSEKAIEGVLARWRKREQTLRSRDSHG